MAPPATPSPHRFLQNSKPKSAARSLHPQSSLRNETSVSAPQFTTAPRFSILSANKSGDEIQAESSSPLAARIRRPVFKKAEDEIDEIAEEEPHYELADDEMLLDSVEFDLPPPKRRRTRTLSEAHSQPAARQIGERSVDDPIVVSSSNSQDNRLSKSLSPPVTLDTHPAPQTPRPPRVHHGPNFVTPLPTAGTSGFPKPNFILPNQSDAPTDEVLPELFSPHRRGQRFLPQGMASMVRDWLLELNSGGRSEYSLPSALGLHGPKDTTDIVVASVFESGGGNYIDIESDSRDRWLLLGETEGRGQGEHNLREGDKLTLKPPVWEIDLGERHYAVAVNWTFADTD